MRDLFPLYLTGADPFMSNRHLVVDVGGTTLSAGNPADLDHLFGVQALVNRLSVYTVLSHFNLTSCIHIVSPRSE
jgi:hypothetical protein